MITKKHYKAIAEIIHKYAGNSSYYFNGIYRPEVKQTTRRITAELADYFEQDNPCFDRERFMKACGL